MNVSVNDVSECAVIANNLEQIKDKHPAAVKDLHQKSNLWSPRSIDDLGHKIHELVEVDQSDMTLNQTRDSINDLKSIISINPTQTCSKKLTKEIMMSSHNVSSLHEIEGRFINKYFFN